MPLLSILLIPKTGVVQLASIKEFSETDLFKRAGFKSATDFEKRTVYRPVGDGINKEIHVYGKVTGRAGQENKYELPPPIAETLFFGTVVLVAKVDENPVSLTVEEWDAMSEALMGGFEDIGSEDTPEQSEPETIVAPLTRHGYAKDGFVVDDDDDDDDNETETTETKKKQKKILLKKPRVKTAAAAPPKKKITTTDQVFASAVQAMTTNSVVSSVSTADSAVNSVLDCANELTEEEYM